MTPERWRQIEELFDIVSEMSSEERDQYLNDQCRDEVLRKQVESLILSAKLADTTIQSAIRGAAESIVSADETFLPGHQIGQYRILRELGHGGMGSVFLATRADEEYKKEVAIKIVKSGTLTQQAFRRFRHERQILANLDHPNIARLLDGGTTETGVPYVVMEYVEGEPIDVFADRNHLNIQERLLLFRKVISAIQYAHQNLVVHRDIKPPNILVTNEGEPKLLDFGIAKLTHPEDPLPSPALTHADVLVMTPDYASPEQIRGELITTACDIYSLGVVLYELLTGKRPYQIKDYTPQEIEKVICEHEPEKPSFAVTRKTTVEPRESDPEFLSKQRKTTPLKLKRKLLGDLDNIVLMAIRKEPHRRYVSAEQMSEDIRRYLEGLPVMARPSTLQYRARKFLHRHTTGVITTAVVILLITGLIAFYTRQLSNERDRAQLEAEKAKQVSKYLIELFQVSDPGESRGKTITARELLERGAGRVEKELADQPAVQAKMMNVIGDVYKSLGMYNDARPLLEKSLKIRQQIYGNNHLDVVESLNSMAYLHYEQGNYDEAERMIRQVLESRRKLLGDRHVDVALSMNDLGWLLFETGKYDAAEDLHRKALSIRQELLGRNSNEVGESLNNLGAVSYEKGEYDASDKLYRESLSIREKLFGKNHPLVAYTMSNLAILLDAEGNYEESEKLYYEVQAIERTLYGDEHPTAVTTMVNLSRVLRKKGDLDSAEALLRKAVQLDRKLRGENHPYVAYDLTSLATVLSEKKDYAAAEPYYREALAIYRAQPEENIFIAQTLYGLGSMLYEKGDPVNAEPLLREGLSIWKKMLPEGHSQTAEGESALGGCLIKLKQFNEAEQLLLRSYTTLKSNPVGNKKQIVRILNRLIELYQLQGKPEKAAQYQELFQKSKQH
jgi:serine/threonine-protein kinase